MINNRIKELRLERGLRQKDVAQAIGVSPQSFGFYENWINKPDPETLIKLADFFEVSVDYLLGRTDDDGYIVKNDIAIDSYSIEEKKIISDYRLLNIYEKKLVKQTLETLTARIDAVENKKKPN